MEEQVVGAQAAQGRRSMAAASRPVRLREVESDGLDRLAMPVQEFSRVLGGGFVPGSLILVGGDPGIGKSTLLLEIAGQAANLHGPVLYVSGEESARQIKMRAERLRLEAEDLNDTDRLELRVYANETHRQAVLVARLDNLGKGASGAAVQNIRLMVGLDKV